MSVLSGYVVQLGLVYLYLVYLWYARVLSLHFCFDLSVSRFYLFLLFLPFVLSRPLMPTEYLLFWYSCYTLYLFCDVGPSTSSLR